jgi:hypothetical protein
VRPPSAAGQVEEANVWQRWIGLRTELKVPIIAGLFAIAVAIVTGIFNLGIAIYNGFRASPTPTPILSPTPTLTLRPLLAPSPTPEVPVSAAPALSGGTQGATVPQQTLPIVSKTIEGLLSFDTGWRQSVLLPPFVNKPEITLVPDGWSAPEDPFLEEITVDKFTAKIFSSNQEGKWKWRARGHRE